MDLDAIELDPIPATTNGDFETLVNKCGELTEEDRHALYEMLYKQADDAPVLDTVSDCKTVGVVNTDIDLVKTFEFLSLPSYIINQKLCAGQPIKPLNIGLECEYENAYSHFKQNHTECFRCKKKLSMQEMFFKTENLQPESTIMYLPKWIEDQWLFENEPINVPADVKQFYSFYILNDVFSTDDVILQNWNLCKEKEKVIEYFDIVKKDYEQQFKNWLNNLSVHKKSRYSTYIKIKNEFFNPKPSRKRIHAEIVDSLLPSST